MTLYKARLTGTAHELGEDRFQLGTKILPFSSHERSPKQYELHKYKPACLVPLSGVERPNLNAGPQSLPTEGARRGSGRGCFVDDEVHRLVGLPDARFQALYSFACGVPMSDERLQGEDPYARLRAKGR